MLQLDYAVSNMGFIFVNVRSVKSHKRICMTGIMLPARQTSPKEERNFQNRMGFRW